MSRGILSGALAFIVLDQMQAGYTLRAIFAGHACTGGPGWVGPFRMARVLVIVSPRMYREAIALAVHRGRPGLDVRVAPPEVAEALLDVFRPHLLVYNDTAEIPAAALDGVPLRVEVVYSDRMDARIHSAEGVSEAGEMSTEMLLRVVDEATELARRGPAQRG